MRFKEISPYEIKSNVFDLIGNKWFLVCAGDENGANCMTASWGSLGHIWNKPLLTTVIRPQRYTKKFVDENEYAAFCFLPEEYRKQLGYLGRVSGRDEDKIKNSGLTPVFEKGTMYFEESDLVIIGRKLYAQWMTEDSFVDKAVAEAMYPEKDYHMAYTYEIITVLSKGE